MKIVCPNPICKRIWNYSGKKRYPAYISCPDCHKSIRLLRDPSESDTFYQTARELRKSILVDYIGSNPTTPARKLVALFSLREGISGSTVHTYVKELRKEGLIKKTGAILQAAE